MDPGLRNPEVINFGYYTWQNSLKSFSKMEGFQEKTVNPQISRFPAPWMEAVVESVVMVAGAGLYLNGESEGHGQSWTRM